MWLASLLQRGVFGRDEREREREEAAAACRGCEPTRVHRTANLSGGYKQQKRERERERDGIETRRGGE